MASEGDNNDVKNVEGQVQCSSETWTRIIANHCKLVKCITNLSIQFIFFDLIWTLVFLWSLWQQYLESRTFLALEFVLDKPLVPKRPPSSLARKWVQYHVLSLCLSVCVTVRPSIDLCLSVCQRELRCLFLTCLYTNPSLAHFLGFLCLYTNPSLAHFLGFLCLTAQFLFSQSSRVHSSQTRLCS